MMRIRHRLPLLALVPALVTALVLVLSFTAAHLASMERLLSQLGNTLTQQLALGAEYWVVTDNAQRLHDLAAEMAANPLVKEVRIHSGRHHILKLQVGSPSAPEETAITRLTLGLLGSVRSAVARERFTVPIQPHVLVIQDLSDEPLPTPPPLGEVEIVLDVEALLAQDIPILLAGVGTSLLILLLALALFVRTSYQLALAIEGINGVVNRYREGELQSRLSVSSPIPELRELGQGINRMATQLQRSHDTLEAQVVERTAALRRLADELGAVLEKSPVGIAFMDGQRVIQRASPELARIFGHPLEEVIGETSEKYYPSSQEFEALGREAYPALKAGNSYETVRPMRYRDGSRIWCRLMGRAVDAADLAKGFVWIVVDVTDQRKAEEALQQAKERAEAADRAKGSFLGMMSHEIRTPLTSILGLAELLRKSPLTPQQQRDVALISQSGANLLKLLEDILDFTRTEGGGLRLADETFSLHGLLRQIQSLFRMRARAKGLRFRTTGLRPLPDWVRGDPQRLGQVLENLLGNAVKFTPRGAVTLRVETREGHSGRCVVAFVVEDTGIGLSEGELPHLFQPFFQGESALTRTHGGAGLGLAIARHWVAAMGGEITGEPLSPRGSRFQVTLPLGLSDAPVGIPAPVPRGQRVVRSLLLVEDEATNRAITRRLLEQEGYRVRECGSGAGALEALRGERSEIILLDLHMPGMDGLETARRIRALPGCRTLPIIGYTADTRPEMQQACLEAGMLAVLTKPVDLRAMRRVLERVGRGLPTPTPGRGSRPAAPAEGVVPADAPLVPPPEMVRAEPEAAASGPADDAAVLVDPTQFRSIVAAMSAPDLEAWFDAFRQDAPRMLRELGEAWREGDYQGVFDAAHGMKGIAKMLGMERLAVRANAFCLAAASRDRARLEGLMGELEPLVELTVSHFTQLLRSAGGGDGGGEG